MESKYNTYLNKDKSELQSLLDECTKLTLDAKITLQKLIKDKFQISDFDSAQLEILESSIQSDYSEIRSLKYLNWLGIDLYDESSYKVILKSKSAKYRDFFGVLIGSILALTFFISIGLWVSISKNGFEIPTLIPALILTTTGVLGLLLLFKTIDRILFFKGFRIAKSGGRIEMSYRPTKGLEHLKFSADSKLKVIDNDNSISLIIEDGEKSQGVLNFNTIGLISMESLNTLVEEFNN